jgi:hypothetical protein
MDIFAGEAIHPSTEQRILKKDKQKGQPSEASLRIFNIQF